MTHPILTKAYEYCVQHGYRFTEPRARVLKILLEAGKPLGAYDILQKLSDEVEHPKPPTVYRAIQFWHQEGFIHCIDSLKSYVACSGAHHIGQIQFLVCNQCDFIQELDVSIDFSPITAAAANARFTISNCTLEIKGFCGNCDPITNALS